MSLFASFKMMNGLTLKLPSNDPHPFQMSSPNSDSNAPHGRDHALVCEAGGVWRKVFGTRKGRRNVNIFIFLGGVFRLHRWFESTKLASAYINGAIDLSGAHGGEYPAVYVCECGEDDATLWGDVDVFMSKRESAKECARALAARGV